MNSAIVLYCNQILKKGIIISTSYVFFCHNEDFQIFLVHFYCLPDRFDRNK